MSKRVEQYGVSLLEALVALVVMAVGAVSIVGLQAALRYNGDLAKQRSEATRLAQAPIEAFRGFSTFSGAPPAGELGWPQVTSVAATSTAGSNTTFTRTITVVERGAGDDEPLSKTVHVTVSWTDRTQQNNTVTLNSIVAGIAPILGGALSIPPDKSILKMPGGRHAAIPPDAINQNDGTSNFSPPNSAGMTWVFNNVTGVIVKTCAPPPGVCTNADASLLHGFVRFATGTAQPSEAMAEDPTDAPVTLQVGVDQIAPVTQSVTCFQFLGSNYIEYFCAVPRLGLGYWSGQSKVLGIPLASSVADSNSSAFKVCRYTPVRSCQPAVGDTIWGTPGSTASCSGASPTPSRLMTNADHPQDYVDVQVPLIDQNFLVIRAGYGGISFSCPDDDAATPLVQGTTWYHQPPN